MNPVKKTLKFFFFPDDDSFNIFINKIKLDLLTHLKTTLSLDPSTNPDINLFNSGLLLIKDYTENEQFADIILEIKQRVVSHEFKDDEYKRLRSKTGFIIK